MSDTEPGVDRKGYVTLTNGDVEAKVVPESVHVWEDRGWEVVEPEDDEPQAGNEGAPNEDTGTVNGIPDEETGAAVHDTDDEDEGNANGLPATRNEEV